MSVDEIMQRMITVNWLVHEDTGLMVAVSPDMRGLMVHGRTPQELNDRTPVAIRAILEAEGHKVVEVVPVKDDLPPGFIPSSRKFEAIAA